MTEIQPDFAAIAFFTTKRDSGGTGLGLAISSQVIQEHGGTLSFKSTPDKGTTATIVLPAVTGVETEDTAQ